MEVNSRPVESSDQKLSVSAAKPDPYMPLHGHGGSTTPAIAAQGSGTYSVGDLDFFIGGYWELFLDLTPPGGAADLVTFPICIPDD